ncbi:hypothetical protein PIL02S_02287 [Paenibacillus illinoisensis]|uniref:Uncharacterized protein n=1 Tax=Paenibacillus illinoisensis TaxID=59845 RepID=A0A2W0CNQ3_9BACL|nr:hypothetical protein PIL02S_02287 [Paenibacillus illinoisensis]
MRKSYCKRTLCMCGFFFFSSKENELHEGIVKEGNCFGSRPL